MSNSVNLSLDVTKTGIQNPLIKVRQGDGGFETLRTTVTANGEPMDLQGWTITFMGTTAGNHKIVDGNVTLVEAPNGIFDYTPSKAWGMDIGDFKIAYFKFVKGDGSASSANFRVSVIEAVDLTQEEAQHYISVVDTTIAEINQHLTDSLANVTQSIADANANANSVASNVTTLGNRVDDYNNNLADIQIGGRNLLLNSKSLFPVATNAGASYTIEDYDANTKMWHITAPAGNTSGSTGVYFSTTIRSSAMLVNGEKWVMSLDIKGSGYMSRFGLQKSSITSPSGNVPTEWTRLSSSGVMQGTSTDVVIYFNTSTVPLDVYVKLPKLENGNVATDWTPAPEDAPSNDAQLVHKTGTETIAGDKTFTGKTSLSGGFNFKLTDLGKSHVDGITDSGSYTSNGTLLGLPISPAYGILDVESNATDTKQTFTQTNIDRPVSWTRVKNNNIGGWSNWVLTFGYSDFNISEVSNDPALIDLATDKTMYAPYEGVEFKGYPNANSGKINIEYWKREQKVGTQTVRFSSSEVTWKWYLPSDDNEQYIAKITVSTEGGRTSTQYYAINVATNSNNLPIMGFLSIYTTHDTKAQRSVMNWLKRTHMNYIQYYDAYYRPENFLAVDDNAFREGADTTNPQGIGVTGTAADYWSDLSRHAVRKDVLQKYVELGHEYGMKNMFYIPWGNTSYVDTDHGIMPEMLLFPTAADAKAHNVKSVPATLTGGEGKWARYSLMKANPSSPAFKNMLFTSAKKALQAIGFDGLHIDTLGPNYGGVYTVDGAEYSNDFAASNGMPNFINDAATFFNTDSWMKQGQNIRMSFNNVGSWGISALANNQNIDYLYAEQWPDMGNTTYNDMFNHVKDIVTADKRGRAVIPAYIHKGYTGTGNFDDNGVIILDLVIMAAGGTHLELGEHMLRSEYFPDAGLGLSDYLKNWLVQYYDFLVAYRRMFTSQNFTNTITSSSHAISVNSIDATKLSVVERTDDYIQSLSLINTNGLNGSEWQDNQLNRNKPNELSNVNLKFNFKPKAVYYVTIENPIPRALEVTNNTVTVPSIDRYTMVYAYK